MLDSNLGKTSTRAKTTNPQSGVTHDGLQKRYTQEEMNAILVQERLNRINEEREERTRMQEQNNIMFRQLYAMVGMQRPDLQVRSNYYFQCHFRIREFNPCYKSRFSSVASSGCCLSTEEDIIL